MIFRKDPDATLDYKIDWTEWLEPDEIITLQSIIAPDGLTVDSASITDAGKSVTVWLSGGAEWQEYRITSRIETSGDRIDDRTITVKVRER